MNLREGVEQLRERRHKAFHGRRYWYNTPSDGRVQIGVLQGLGGDIWIAAYFRENGARKKVNTARLPALIDPDSLQALLDQWAHERQLQGVA